MLDVGSFREFDSVSKPVVSAKVVGGGSFAFPLKDPLKGASVRTTTTTTTTTQRAGWAEFAPPQQHQTQQQSRNERPGTSASPPPSSSPDPSASPININHVLKIHHNNNYNIVNNISIKVGGREDEADDADRHTPLVPKPPESARPSTTKSSTASQPAPPRPNTAAAGSKQPQPPTTKPGTPGPPSSTPGVPAPGVDKAAAVTHYAVGKTIGEGTFGKVKAGVHKLTGLPVAIKILEKERIVDLADVERVKREIHILTRVRHPNVIRLFEVIDSPRHIFLIMEHCPMFGTEVVRSNGARVKVEDLKVDDKIFTENGGLTTVLSCAHSTSSNMIKISDDQGRELVVTPEHILTFSWCRGPTHTIVPPQMEGGWREVHVMWYDRDLSFHERTIAKYTRPGEATPDSQFNDPANPLPKIVESHTDDAMHEYAKSYWLQQDMATVMRVGDDVEKTAESLLTEWGTGWTRWVTPKMAPLPSGEVGLMDDIVNAMQKIAIAQASEVVGSSPVCVEFTQRVTFGGAMGMQFEPAKVGDSCKILYMVSITGTGTRAR
jgi:hypothetical protein